jgi:putative endonuclease
MKDYYVYIMTNRSGTLYVGVTNDLMRRVREHKDGAHKSFTKQYNVDRLVYFEQGNDVEGAITREKQLKGWLRKRKLALIAAENPKWHDLSDGWYGDGSASSAEGQILRSAQNDNFGVSSREYRRGSPASSAEDQILRSAQNDRFGVSLQNLRYTQPLSKGT